MNRGYCREKCYRLDFPIPILYKQSHTYWVSELNRYRTEKPHKDKQGRPARAIRYTTNLKQSGLAKCKFCIYITAKPTKPGTKCPCCKQTLSQSIRDIKHRLGNGNEQQQNI